MDLNFFNNKNCTLGVFVSQSSVLEIILFDNRKKTIVKRGRTEIQYDLTTRQLNKVEMLEATIQNMLQKLEIPIHFPIVITLPSICTGKQVFPAQLSDEEVYMALVSDTEKNYFFKKQDPTVSWQEINYNSDTNTQEIIYAAIQSDYIEQIEGLFDKSDLNLVCIESSYIALARGLWVSGILDVLGSEDFWSIVLITSISVVFISLKNSRITEIKEISLAVKSLSTNELYSTLVKYCDENLKGQNLQQIILVSEVPDILSETLSKKLEFNCEITCINQTGRDTVNSIVIDNQPSIEDNQQVFLQTIGAASIEHGGISGFNFLVKGRSPFNKCIIFNLFGKNITINSKFLEKMLFINIISSIVMVALLYIVVSSTTDSLGKTLSDLNAKRTEMEQTINSFKSQDNGSVQFNAKNILPTTYEKNSKIVQSFNAISEVIPEKLWIKNFEINDGLSVFITGNAYSIVDIINYYQNLAQIASFKDFKISSIKIMGNNNSSEDIKIIPKDENNSTSVQNLPSLPDISNIQPISDSTRKYYQFEFGNNMGNSNKDLTSSGGNVDNGSLTQSMPTPLKP